MMRYRLSDAARADIIEILAWTHNHFGELARRRYEHLLATALRDISTSPERPGSKDRGELGAGARSWHLRLSGERARTENGVVHRPHHFIIYRVEPADLVVVGRVLHDAMELERHMTQGGASGVAGQQAARNPTSAAQND
ncbi:type II toxin-antitoxin system RelE/ParE family toxin [Pseudomonas lopnurensis]|uniref:type II toxin-antitoxin system RelE/ParE family toxin n=1 Tax=Pseudomonas lopnurensis TaxID=1477517 RepID=UPI00187B0076|nr:type II toxin-antitoxin system RelE/ParE family toxin [Pseudomonas lopnurensis]MBE7373877.1 type II toxin-antitoxin system RelE/ParE family toxin [Pseudomonas lopnurensis]